MERKCRKCGTTENVNFDGMCKSCYEKSIIIKEREEDSKKEKERSNKQIDWKELMKEKYLAIETILLTIVAICVIIICITTKNNENMTAKYESLENRYNQTTKDLNKAKEETQSKKKEISELKQEDKIKEIENKINGLNTEVTNLQTQKDSLNTEIATLKEETVKLKGEPKTYPAGQLVAGTDVPVGKYKIFDGNSNFVVYSAYGDLKVNIILGSGSFNVNEYIYTFQEGDKIEARSSFKLVSVE